MENFQHIEYGLHENVVRMQGLLVRVGCKDDPAYEALEEAKTLISDKTYVVAVMGEFKRGKSTLINALLGSRVLPADVEPTTATLNRIVFGTKPSVTVCFHNGDARTVAVSELAAYVTKQELDGGSKAGDIDEVVVAHPSPLTRNHIEIYDTPGLNDDLRMTDIAIRMVDKADMVLVPIHARAPYSEVEQDFVCKLIRTEGIDHLMFVVTFLDQLGEPGIDYDYDRFMYGRGGIAWRIKQLTFQRLERDPQALARAHELLDDLNLCSVSAKQALDALTTGNQAQLAESRLDEFRQQLVGTLTARQTIATAHKVRRAIEQGASLVATVAAERVATLCEDAHAIDDSLAVLRGYPKNMRRAMNAQLAAQLEREAAIRDALGALAHDMPRCYIAPLGHLHSGDAASLRAALSEGDAAREELEATAVAEAASELLALFDGLAASAAGREQSLALDLLAVPDVLLVSRNAMLAQRMHEGAAQVLAGIRATWDDPFASMGDEELETANPIMPIREQAVLHAKLLVESAAAACNRVRAIYLRGLLSQAEKLSSWAEHHGASASRAAHQRMADAQAEQEMVASNVSNIVDVVNRLADDLHE